MGDKGEGRNSDFCCVFALRFSKLNLTLVALRSLADRGRKWKGFWGSLSFRGVIECETRREREGIGEGGVGGGRRKARRHGRGRGRGRGHG